MSFKNTLKKHLFNVRGKRFDQKFVVFESDDWGSIRVPNKKTAKDLIEKGSLSKDDPFAIYDCLETEQDLNMLFETLSEFKDYKGNPPVITGNMVMGNPDFEKIKEDDFRTFYLESFTNTYEKHEKRQTNTEILKEGITKKLFAPQFHAREHLNSYLWMKYLQSGIEEYRYAFEQGCFSINDPNPANRRHNIMATYDYSSEENFNQIVSSIEEGLQQFKAIFGFGSETTVCPAYVWDDRVEKVFNRNEVYCFQGSKYQQIPSNNGKSFRRKFRYIGQQENGNTYFIRNGLFEPSLDHSIDWVDKCLESIRIAFKWNKPAIIGTHRINFSGHISPENRDLNILMLKDLLKRIKTIWPDIEFVSSNKLYTSTTN